MQSSKTRGNASLLFALYGLLLLIPTWRIPLMESTEGRYAEIAREMLASGNYLEPSLNGIFHFHKPPVPYWGMALGMKLFGVNDLGVRFFGVIAALLALLFFHRTARTVLADDSRARSAAFILASSALFLSVSRVVSTDIYLTAAVAAAQCFLFRQVLGNRQGLANSVGYAVALGLGFICKGPVVFLFTLLPFLVAKPFDPAHRRVFSGRQILFGLGVFLAVALPWYLLVIQRHPELLGYFLKVQTVDRVATDRFARSKPFWFFFAVFAGTFLPWTLQLLRGIARPRQLPPAVRILLIYLVVPFVVFTLAKSKMATYILPFYGVAAIITAHLLHEQPSRILGRITAALLLLLAIALGAAGFFSSYLIPYRWLLLGVGIVAIGVVFRIARADDDLTMVGGTSGFLTAAALVLYLLYPAMEPASKGFRGMASQLDALDPGRQLELVVWRDVLPSLSFYRQKLAVMAFGRQREVGFQPDGSYRRWYIDSAEGLNDLVRRERRLFLVTEPIFLEQFQGMTGYRCTPVFNQRRYTAYLCSRDSTIPTP